MTPHFKLFLILLAVASICVVGQMDYEDAVSQEQLYCKNVREGVWPDYDSIYEKVCKKYEKTVDIETTSN